MHFIPTTLSDARDQTKRYNATTPRVFMFVHRNTRQVVMVTHEIYFTYISRYLNKYITESPNLANNWQTLVQRSLNSDCYNIGEYVIILTAMVLNNCVKIVTTIFLK